MPAGEPEAIRGNDAVADHIEASAMGQTAVTPGK